MFRFSKDMLNLFEEYLRRKEGLARFEGAYANPDDTDTKGRPKTKPFVPGSLRFPRGLNHSKGSRTTDKLEIFSTAYWLKLRRAIARWRS